MKVIDAIEKNECLLGTQEMSDIIAKNFSSMLFSQLKDELREFDECAKIYISLEVAVNFAEMVLLNTAKETEEDIKNLKHIFNEAILNR